MILTVGHPNHPLDEFLAILKAHEVEQLVDVRSIPKSRYNPQFGQEASRRGIDAMGTPQYLMM